MRRYVFLCAHLCASESRASLRAGVEAFVGLRAKPALVTKKFFLAIRRAIPCGCPISAYPRFMRLFAYINYDAEYLSIENT